MRSKVSVAKNRTIFPPTASYSKSKAKFKPSNRRLKNAYYTKMQESIEGLKDSTGEQIPRI